jgi:hypothetical protein
LVNAAWTRDDGEQQIVNNRSSSVSSWMIQ